MRIVGGHWAGTALTSPGGRVRPTAEALRAACFDLPGLPLEDARVLDLFAGTGALGLEALSRGARSVDFVENGASALHALKANVAKLRVRDRTRVFKRDALTFLESVHAGAYALALADPPWTSRLADRVVERWKEVPFADVLVVEHAADRHVPPGGHTHRMGDAGLTVYRHRRRRG